MLKGAGYATAAFGKWHLGHREPFSPMKNGFDEFLGIPYSNDNGPLHPTVKGIPPLPFYRNDEVLETDPDQSQFTPRLTRLAREFIRANRDRPFFLYLPHVMPHVPIFRTSNWKSKRGIYGDVVEELDFGVGEILNDLDRPELKDNTIVIFMSDNGPFLSYGNHAGRAEPYREGKLTTFDGGLRVPFVVRWPGKVPAGRASDELLSGLDLLPTLARIIGAKLPTERKIDGVDLSPLLLGVEGAKERESFACYSGSELHAVRRGNWKLHVPHEYLTVDGPPGKDGKPANFANMKPNPIEQSGIRGIASRHGYRVEKIELSLFDLENDRAEAKNVAQEHPEIVAELQQLAAEYRRDLGDSLTGVRGAGLRAAGDAK
jgi:arylsulfatase